VHALRHEHVIANLSSHAEQRQLAQPETQSYKTSLSSVLIRPRVTNCKQDPRHTPPNSQDRRSHRIAQASEEKRRDEGRVVLKIIAVGALRAVEEVLSLGQWLVACGHGVGVGVGDACGFAEVGHASAMPEGEEEGRGRDEHDVTGASG